MALEYFLYRTDFNNTLVDRSNNSFAPLPPDTGEIYIDYFIPDIQPLYLYRESGGNIIYNNEQTVNEYIKETSPLPTSEDSVLQYQFTGYTASTDTKIDNLVSSLSGVSTGVTITTIDFHSDASASVTLTNQVLAEQFLANNNRVIKRVNLSNALQLRLITRVVTSSASINNPRLILKYKTGAFSTTVGDYINVGITEIATSLTSVGISESSWIDITPLAKEDVYLTITQIGGDGAADPAVGNTFVEIKNLVKTADVILSGITEPIFTGYTASTNQRLVGIEGDINYISGVTDTKLNIVDFNSHTGITNTRFENIENNIGYLSGQTDTKLAITAFNTFTGTTLPANYYNKTEINAYSASTLSNINSRVLKSGDIMTGALVINNNLTITGITKFGNVTPDVNQQNFAVLDVTTNKIANSGLKYHVYGSEYQLVSGLASTSTNSITPVIKLSMTTTNLPVGIYKVTVSWVFSRNSASNSALYDIQLNGTSQGTRNPFSFELSDTTDIRPANSILYLSLSGINTITLRHWGESAANSTTTSDAKIELIRVE